MSRASRKVASSWASVRAPTKTLITSRENGGIIAASKSIAEKRKPISEVRKAFHQSASRTSRFLYLPEIPAMNKAVLIITTLLLTLSLSACVGVGYSSRGGWFVWPGGCGLLVLILLIVFFMRRRR
jgi:hypothetical protein